MLQKYKVSVENNLDINHVCSNCLLNELPNFVPYEDLNSSSIEISSDNEEKEPDLQQYDCFKQRGMHFLHADVRSILPQIDQIRPSVTYIPQELQS